MDKSISRILPHPRSPLQLYLSLAPSLRNQVLSETPDLNHFQIWGFFGGPLRVLWGSFALLIRYATLSDGHPRNSVDYAEAVSGWQETVTTYRTNVVPRSCSPKSKAYSKSPRLNYSS